MRLFVAIELSDPARSHLGKVQEVLRPVAGQVSWTAVANLHLTLKFLGEVPDPHVPAICHALRTTSVPDETQISATRMQCFPERGSIRIVGAEMSGDVATLQTLVTQIEDICHDLGFRREGRVYRPHATLARARAPLPGSVRAKLEQASATLWPGPRMCAHEFVLMQSILGPKGAQYLPVDRIGIGGNTTT